ncbi:ABC transporter permease [Metabacillus malikii]|uniref:ABC-2 type transport system permease protein n=1 Tax=Metabacillus malikii TaxID=1504265 RepID=A0ABT9ZHR5_9BACI|nr:ABC transporter permease [Metabacillus malikii]MDQ0231812.1 ABC-2 type transport system permease protein [Metabacillus malikii]
MISILRAKFQLFIRKPMLMIGMTVMSILFATLIGSTNDQVIAIPVYTDIENVEDSAIWKELTESEGFEFTLVSEEQAKEKVRKGDVEASVQLKEESYTIIIATETENFHVLESFLQSVYQDLLVEKNIEESTFASDAEKAELLKEINNREENPLVEVETASFRGSDSVVIDNQMQTIFGFSLFFVIYTISYNVHHIIQERQLGVWNRMILSPLKKWEMYAGNLLYSFLLGYFQIALIFFIFRYIIGVDFYGGFGKTLLILVPYVFSIVALMMFIVSLVKNTQQYNAIISLVAVSMSMLGGAYWPLEIVTSDFLLMLSDFIPIKHAMEALKHATIYNESISELMYPMSILTIIGVVLMGIGINVMERKSE